MSLPIDPLDYLRWLPGAWYKGRAWVHWTIDGRKQGWLDEIFHARAREVLLHTMAR